MSNNLLEQEEYSVKKRVENILNNKGKDLDFIILPDYEPYIDSNMNKYHIDRFDESKSNIRIFSKEMNFDLKEETIYLGNHSYSLTETKNNENCLLVSLLIIRNS